MISNVNQVQQIAFQPQLSQRQLPASGSSASSSSFDIEDQAIISSQATLQNELEKFNTGGDNAVNLAVAEVMAKTTVSAELNVIQTKKDMFDDILNMAN